MSAVDINELESMVVAVGSTCHVSGPEAAMLDNEAITSLPVATWRGEFGWIFYLSDVPLIDLADGEWPGLYALCVWAGTAGIQWVRLDRDGDKLPGLPEWEW